MKLAEIHTCYLLCKAVVKKQLGSTLETSYSAVYQYPGHLVLQLPTHELFDHSDQ